MPRLLMMLMALVPLWLLGAAPADAGRSCTQRSLTERQMTQAIATATQLDQQLNHRSDDMVILARIGSDISEHGLKYTHAGLALRTEGGRWLVTHQLNECGTGRSMLRRQGLLQFLLDDPHAYDVLVLTPAQPLQMSVRRQITSGWAAGLHQPVYSIIAYPGSLKYQNSNQWVLEVVTQAQAAVEGISLRSHAEAVQAYRARGFRGTEIRLSPLKRLFGGLRNNLRFDDHPARALRNGRFEVVTVRSLTEHLRRTGDLKSANEIPAPL